MELPKVRPASRPALRFCWKRSAIRFWLAQMDEEYAGSQQAVVFGEDIRCVTEPGVGAEFGAEAAQVLIDQPEIQLHARDVGGLGSQIGAYEEIGRADGILAEPDQNARVGGGNRGRASGGGGAEGFVGCGVIPAGLDGLESVEGGGRRDGLTLQRLHIAERLPFSAGFSAFRAHLKEYAGLGAAPAIACGQVIAPALWVKSVAQQNGATALRCPVTGFDQLPGLGVIGSRKLADRHGDKHIGQRLGLFDVALDAGIECAVEHGDDGTGIRAGNGGLFQMHSDHRLGVQVTPQDIRGQVVEDAAIDKEVAAAILHRRENAGNRDGSADGLGQRSAGKGDRSKRVQVSGHAAKGDGQAVVVKLLPVVAKEVAGEKFIHAAVRKQGVAQGWPVLEAEGDGCGVLAAILASPETGIDIGGLQGEDAGESIADGESAHLRRGVPGGVGGSDQGSHAGAGHAVDGDVVLLDPLDDADVGQAQGASALESQADDGAVGRNNSRQGRDAAGGGGSGDGRARLPVGLLGAGCG